MGSAHLSRSVQIIWIRLRCKEIGRSETVGFCCIVDCAHRGHYVTKGCTLLLCLCGGVEGNEKYKNSRSSRFARCNYETVDLTKGHKGRRMWIIVCSIFSVIAWIDVSRTEFFQIDNLLYKMSLFIRIFSCIY
jgi:hypothetical protein